MGEIHEILFDGPQNPKLTLVLAHGAGAPMDSPFMNQITRSVASDKFRVARFEFPYMAGRRSGTRRGPDRPAVLQQTWYQVIAQLGEPSRIAIGGKSMGGRIASMIADEAEVQGLVCLGYPFHPPGRPDNLRTAHLASLRCPTLVVQGERDPFGNQEEVEGYVLSRAIRVHWIPDGDHSLKPRKKSGFTEAGNIALAVESIRSFLHHLANG